MYLGVHKHNNNYIIPRVDKRGRVFYKPIVAVTSHCNVYMVNSVYFCDVTATIGQLDTLPLLSTLDNTYTCDPSTSATMATGSSRHVDVQAYVIAVLILVLIVVLTMQTDLVLSKYAPTL